MNLQDYKWFRNPRGMHNKGVISGGNAERWIRPQMGWAKLVAGGNEYVRETAVRLLEHNCMPIVRIYRPAHGAQPPEPVFFDSYREYIEVGALWFELYNEPNLEGEWPQKPGGWGSAVYLDWANREEVIVPMMDNWLDWAERLIDMGGYPAFPALADSADHRHASVYWIDAFLSYLKETYESRFRDVIGNGLWCATHPYLYNHFYQEVPGGPAWQARPPQDERANEGGWHFEYPYDPLQQRRDPGRTVFGGTPLAPMGDTNALLGGAWAFTALLKKYFDAGPVPVVGTEGGIWRIPDPSDSPHVIDDRYPGYTWESHAEATMALWRWICEKAPPWFWGVTVWQEDDYYDLHGGPVLAIQRMEAEAPILKDVPSIETDSGDVEVPGVTSEVEEEEEERPVEVARGPGPVHGQPDFHWLILAPGLQAEWFFQAARRYWQSFRPTLMTDWDMIGYLPRKKSLAVTVLARPDTIDYLDANIRDEWPNVFYDPIVADDLAAMQAELDRRADAQRRFG
jgi:hypothetical protein